MKNLSGVGNELSWFNLENYEFGQIIDGASKVVETSEEVKKKSSVQPTFPKKSKDTTVNRFIYALSNWRDSNILITLPKDSLRRHYKPKPGNASQVIPR